MGTDRDVQRTGQVISGVPHDAEAAAGRVRYPHIRTAWQLARAVSVLVLAVVTLIAFGYLFDLPVLYRPVVGVAGIHPLTLVMIAALALGGLLTRPVGRPGAAAMLAFGVAVALAGARIGEIALFGAGVAGIEDALLPEAARAGVPVRVGLNTALCVVALGLGQLLRAVRPLAGLLVASAAPFVLLTVFIDYVYGLHSLRGAMAAETLATLLPLSLVGLVGFARSRQLRPLFSDTQIGRLARMQIVIVLVLPWVTGFALAWVSDQANAGSVAVLVSAAIWMLALVLVLSTLAQERTDAERRVVERGLFQRAVSDALTGLANRHAVARAYDSLPGDATVGVIMADLDNFKQVNDRHGHNTGDRVLAQAATALRDALHGPHMLARWGGEEFLAVLPGVGPTETRRVAERLRMALKDIVGPGGAAGEITGSFGVAAVAAGETELTPAIRRADEALLFAKGAGRDRLVSSAAPGGLGDGGLDISADGAGGEALARGAPVLVRGVDKAG